MPNSRETGWALGTPLVTEEAAEAKCQLRPQGLYPKAGQVPTATLSGSQQAGEEHDQLPWGRKESQKEECLVGRKSRLGKHLLKAETSPMRQDQPNVLKPWEWAPGKGD